MPVRAHLYRTAADNAGNVVPNLSVAVYQAGTTALIPQPLYTQDIGSETLANPFVTSTGIIDFYIDDAASVRIGLTPSSGVETYVDNIEVNPPPEATVQATSTFEIINAPVTGQFLECTALGQASWVDADDLVSTKASPLSTLKTYDFSTSNLSDMSATDANGASVTPTYVSTTSDTLPPGYTFTKALRLPVASVVALRIPPQVFPEHGEMFFAYKTVAASSGAGAATLEVVIDSNVLTMTLPHNPELLNTWNVGYLGDIPPGTHSIKLLHTPGSDTASYVEIGNISVQYGNNIPFHTHQGNGAASTVLGPNATANFASSTALGGTAQALGIEATAIGEATSAEAQGTALGSTAYAGSSGVALGYYARNAVGTFGGVAVGVSASSTADNAVAVGEGTLANGARSVAVGPEATSSGVESAALGYQARALAQGSVAIGTGAVADTAHTNSVALGPGAATTAPNQVMLGTASTAVEIPGALTASGPTVLGGETSTVGFFGSTGTQRPSVTGSRGGNLVLAQLLTALDALGLIRNNTVA